MKTTKLIFALVCAICLGGLCSCEDNRTQYLDEFDTLVYFRNGGEQTITLYSVGDNARYSIPICKGGSVLDATATARIAVMDQAQLDIYNMENDVKYVQLSDDCFEFLTATEFSFASIDPYQVAVVELKTDKIREYQEASTDGSTYVLGLQVYSPQKVSRDINRLILMPEVDVPVVSFGVNGEDFYNFTPESPEDNVLSSTLTINMPASSVEWEFDCTVEAMGQDWLDAYNAENGTDYALLSDEKFTLPDKIHFEVGKAEASFEVVVNRVGFSPFEYFAVPIKLASCSKPELQIDTEAVYLLLVRLEPTLDTISLTASMLYVPASFTATNDGEGVPALVDGNTTSYWHSNWASNHTGDDVYGVYIDITLNSPLNVVRFTYWTRSSNSNGVPKHIRIGVSNDGEDWEMIGEVKSDLPTAAGESGTLPTFYRADSFTHVRFGIVESALGLLTGTSTNSTALGELVLEGATM